LDIGETQVCCHGESPLRTRDSAADVALAEGRACVLAVGVVNTVVPTAAVLVLLDPIFPVPVTLTAVIMMLVVVLLVLRPPLPHGNETPPPDAQQPSR